MRMFRSTLSVLFVSTCLLACATETTSIGARGTRASANTADDIRTVPPIRPDPVPDDTSEGLICAGRGYTWASEAAGPSCAYLLPEEPPHPWNPYVDPAQWDPPHHVVVEIFSAQNDFSRDDIRAYYLEDAEGCEGGHGWHYLAPPEGERPTAFVLCPLTCEAAQKPENLLRLSAFFPCDFIPQPP